MKKHLIILVRTVETLNQAQQCCPVKICEFCFDICPRGLRFRLRFGHTLHDSTHASQNTGNLARGDSPKADRPWENESHQMNAAIPERRPATEEISGVIERVTFHNDDSGFCVLQ